MVTEETRQGIKDMLEWAKEDMKSNVYIDMAMNLDDSLLASSFLGTVFSIMPSGKYWTWWASSNVDDEEMKADADYLEALEEEAGELGLFIFNGEGDPCDMFAGRTYDEAFFTIGGVTRKLKFTSITWKGFERFVTLEDVDGQEFEISEDSIESISVEEE